MPRRDELASEQALDRELAQRSLREFMEQAWPILEPATPFVPGWHLDAIAEHLEAVTRGQLRNLVINIPPRHCKSLLVSVFWPVWEWITTPERRWLYASYAASLSTRDSLKCRRLIESPWFQARWGDRFRLTSDQNVKTRFENDKTGYRIATSVGGSSTGEGGDRIVVDDPHNVQEAESDAIRTATLTWWDEVMATRLNDPKTGAKVIVMQRCHQSDLTGHVRETGGYEHLSLAAEYDGRQTVTSIGFSDPRTQPDELLWPQRFGRAEIDALKREMGSYAAAGQLQQQPAPRTGGLFQREWFAIVDAAPADAARCRGWDKAGTEGDGDYSAGVKLAAAKGIYYVEDVVRGQWSSGGRNAVMRQTAELDGRLVRIQIEQEPGSSGKESAEYSVQQLAGYDVHAEPSTGDKVTRARPLSAQAEAGNVKIVRSERWNRDFLDELCDFPRGKHDDQVDGASIAFNKLALGDGYLEWMRQQAEAIKKAREAAA